MTVRTLFKYFVLVCGLAYIPLSSAARDSISFQHISTRDGLPQSTVNAIFQDSQGYLWFGTYDGLSRFDGYQFVTFKSNPADNQSLSNNIVVSIVEDDTGKLWIGTAQNGVNRFDPETGKFEQFLSQSDDFDSLSHSQVNRIYLDPTGRVWIATAHGLNLYLPDKNAFAHFYHNPLDDLSLPEGPIVDLTGDGHGNLWIASQQAISLFNIDQQTFTAFLPNKTPKQINRIYRDTDNSLWIGTRFDGLYHLDAEAKTIDKVPLASNKASNPLANDVRDILRTQNGDLWIATDEEGLKVRRKGDNQFLGFKRNSADPHSLSNNDAWNLFQDTSGLLWIGTSGGGLNMTKSFNSQFSRLMHDPGNTSSLSHEFVWDIKEDSDGNIWFATLNGLDKYNPNSDKVEHLTQFQNKSASTVSRRIQGFTFGQNDEIWFGTQQGQLGIYNTQTKTTQLINRNRFPAGYVSYDRIRMVEKDRFGHVWVSTDDGLIKVDIASKKIVGDYQFAEANKLGDAVIRTLLQDEQGIIWLGTWNKGLQRYDPEFDSLTTYMNIPGDATSISNNTVRSLFIDSQGNLWVGTFNGLNRIASEQRRLADSSNPSLTFQNYLEKDGLPNSAIYAIESDTNGRLWLSTNNGLSQFDPSTNQFTNYSTLDGLPANEFNGNAVLKSSTNNIYFGSVGGVAIVNPQKSSSLGFEPKSVITSLSVNNENIRPLGVKFNDQSNAAPIEFDYNQNDLTLKFAALDYRNVNNNQFSYRLLPYRTNWTQISQPSQAVFTNLDPSQYTFELKASNSDGIWSEHISRLLFTIKPPFWLTWWAYIIYAVLAISSVIFFYRRHQKTLQEQRNINQHLRRVDQLKDEFLANTSHELRTPLNGIIGIAESLKEGSAGMQNQKTLNHLKLIIDGGKRLAQLVNDILDFKKLSHHNLILQRKALDLNPVLEVVISLLEPLATQKNLTINNQLGDDLPLVFADEDRLQQILHNLIGNAIKYTEKGHIDIHASLNVNELRVWVKDTGIGIEKDQAETIFEPFEQLELPDSVSQKGTGLGLSVTKQLVEQHDGEIWVESNADHGATFYFTLPCWLENYHDEDPIQENNLSVPIIDVPASDSPKVLSQTKSDKRSQGKILIADDDPINLQVLSDLLEMNSYQVVCANNGDQALEIGMAENFELAILDIMMPGLNGYQVTKKLREKYSAIELPILLLSARNQPGDVTAGFEAGANDYVTKPIERQVLMSRIETMRLLGGLVEAKRQKEHALTLKQACEQLGRYFPKPMVNKIITQNTNDPLVAERKQITVLFADLAGFTSISDRFEPEAITDILNSFLSKMGELVEAHQGILNEILGDGLVVLFGALDTMDKQAQAQNAASLALKMQSAMTKLSEEWLDAGFDHNVKLRIGIHQDYSTVGNFGSKDIVAFRAVGSGVNFAARLESYAQSGEIAVSYPIYAQCRDSFKFSDLEEIQFKGFNHPLRVCRLIGRIT